MLFKVLVVGVLYLLCFSDRRQAYQSRFCFSCYRWLENLIDLINSQQVVVSF